MKILIPVPVSKSLPEIKEGEPFSGCVIVRYTNKHVTPDYSALAFAFCDKSGRWEDATPEQREKFECGNTVIEWYKEVEIESLFPDKDTSYDYARNAAENKINGIVLHQEGQSAFKNHLLRKLNGNGNGKAHS